MHNIHSFYFTGCTSVGGSTKALAIRILLGRYLLAAFLSLPRFGEGFGEPRFDSSLYVNFNKAGVPPGPGLNNHLEILTNLVGI